MMTTTVNATTIPRIDHGTGDGLLAFVFPL